MGFTNRSLTKRNPMLFPRDPVGTQETEAYLLGCDARNDFRALDENPYDNIAHADHWNWARGWQDTDREREAEED